MAGVYVSINVSVAGEVFAVVGVKGGVGVTTVAVNVATVLAQKAAESVLLIDFNPACGDAAVFLGADPRFTTVDALANTTRLDGTYLKALVAKTTAGPDLLASPDRVVVAGADARRVRAVVEAASRCYRYVVLDVPSWGSSFDGALELTSSITVVTTQDVAALRNGNRLTLFLRRRYGVDRIRVVTNRYDHAADIVDGDLEIALGGPLYGMFPSADRLAVDALNRGLPVVLENQSKLAVALRSYARSLVAGSESESGSNASPRLVGIPGGRRRHPPTR
jgi:pilus assembly protein CpaE